MLVKKSHSWCKASFVSLVETDIKAWSILNEDIYINLINLKNKSFLETYCLVCSWLNSKNTSTIVIDFFVYLYNFSHSGNLGILPFTLKGVGVK